MDADALPPLAGFSIKVEQGLLDHIDAACRHFRINRSSFFKVAAAKLVDDIATGVLTEEDVTRLALRLGAGTHQKRVYVGDRK